MFTSFLHKLRYTIQQGPQATSLPWKMFCLSRCPAPPSWDMTPSDNRSDAVCSTCGIADILCTRHPI